MKEDDKYDWEALISKYEESGLRVLEFCEREQIPKSGFYQARKRHGRLWRTRERKSRRGSFVEVSVPTSSEESVGKKIELYLPQGIVLRLS